MLEPDIRHKQSLGRTKSKKKHNFSARSKTKSRHFGTEGMTLSYTHHTYEAINAPTLEPQLRATLKMLTLQWGSIGSDCLKNIVKYGIWQT